MREQNDRVESKLAPPYGRPLEWGETVKHEEETPLFPKNIPAINCAWQLFLVFGFPFYCWLFAVIAINYLSHSAWNKYIQDGALPFEIVATVFIICAFLVPIIHALIRNSERVVITDRRIFFAPSAYARPEFRSVLGPIRDALGKEVWFKHTLSATIERHFNRSCLVFQAYNPNWSIVDDDGPIHNYPFPVFDPQSVYDRLPAYLRVSKFVPDPERFGVGDSYYKLKQLCEEHLAQRKC